MIIECDSRTLDDNGLQVEVRFTMSFQGADRIAILDAIKNNKMTLVVKKGLECIGKGEE